MYVAWKERRACFLDNAEEGTTTEASPEHKWLPGDTVDASGAVVYRSHRNIVGIVDIRNRTRCGLTSRGVPLYYFHPLDTSYPTMVVAWKQAQTENLLAIAAFEHWTDARPRAGIHTMIGVVGDVRAEEKALYARCIAPSRAACTVTPPDVSVVTAYDTVLHIDPPGCEDVDDVFCWNLLDDGYEFAIAIADVSAWVTEGTDMDRIAHQKAETVYVDGQVAEPMLPSELSTKRASLRADGVARPVVALVYTIRHGVLVATEWKSMNIIVSQTYTYDTIYTNPEACRILRECLHAITGTSVPEDSHQWVESAMITYNTAAAQLLKHHGVGILRSHAGTRNTEWKSLADQTGCRELAFLGMSKGTYVYAQSQDTAHNGLGLSLYCHASSPLRRYVDLMNQRYIHSILTDSSRPTNPVYPSHFNMRSRLIQSLERDLWCLRNLNTNALTTQSGFLIAFKPIQNTWSVYVPVWKRTVRAKYNGMEALESGMAVTLQAYTNLASVSWKERIVCEIVGSGYKK